ncbi:MAG: replication-associated recombination protein A [Coriobacteriales bacterium]|jgi:putative ATPase|nr:replication-associated recombination protein A [Coriobacteriales bacterium]
MNSLFSEIEQGAISSVAPLAVRMRPTSLDDLVGQEAVLGQGSWLRNAIEDDSLSSIILFGPAGTGKTTLARIIAAGTKAHFTEVSAISGGVSDLRRVIDEAAKRLSYQNIRTILFVDEIHRFSRSQQDALLHAVEDKIVVLVGATTENPAFEVNTALLSRSRVIEFAALEPSDITTIIQRALQDPRGLNAAFTISADALEAIATMAAGDGRSALTTLEMAAQVRQTKADEVPEEEPDIPAQITLTDVLEATPRSVLPYDKQGDVHYDVISAFIKSMRGSDPDAVVYWLARMLEGGEDPKFIARRILIFASEDIGNADPQALLVANAAFAAVERIGLPECQLNLSQAALYMALAPKSNASYRAIGKARGEIASGPLRAVPNHLRDRHRPGSEDYGVYAYPHLEPSGYVEQQYLPDGLERGQFFTPGERGWEAYRVEARQRDQHPDGPPAASSDERSIE